MNDELLTRRSQVTEAIIQSLAKIPMFGELSPPELRIVAGHMVLFEVGEGELVLEEGEQGDYVCFVAAGSLAVIKESSSGERALITVLGTGRSLGEMALIDNAPRSATVIAQTDAKLVTLTRKNFEAILDENFQIGFSLLRGIARMLSLSLRQTSNALADHMMPIL